MLDSGTKPLTKYDLLRQRKHFTGLSNVGSTEPSYVCPVGQWPHHDHQRQRTHYDEWNMTTNKAAGIGWRPSNRYIVPTKKTPRESRVRHIEMGPYPTKGHFHYTKLQHFDHHLSRTIDYSDLNFDRKHRPTPAGNPGEEWSVENKMARKIDVAPSSRRNGMPCKKPGDKQYDVVEHSDMFHRYGATISHMNFGKQTGTRPHAYRKPMRGGAELGMSTRSDSFGRSMLPLKSTGNKKPYHVLAREAAKRNEISAVHNLPEEVGLRPDEPVVVPPPVTKSGKKKK